MHIFLLSFLLESQSRWKNQLDYEHLENKVYFLFLTLPNLSDVDLQDSCNHFRIPE